jgi:DNA-binding PadR family transcriptional regulator
MPAKSLSVAEYTVLGVVWRDGPCTTYSVMLAQAKSASSFFRKKASSTYAVVQKLLDRGLVVTVGEDGPRGDRQIQVTPAGTQALHDWISSTPEVEVAYSNDLVRLRLNFVELLDGAERMAFIQDCLRMLHKLLEEQHRARPATESIGKSIALLGMIYETQARIDWLIEVKEMLASEDRRVNT